MSAGGAGGRLDSRHPGVVLALLLFAGLGLGVLHNSLRARHKTDPVLALVQTLLYPSERGAAIMRGGLNLDLGMLLRGKELEAENARLLSENAALKTENEQLRSAAAENARLRADLGLVQSAKSPPLVAEVIGWLPTAHFESIILSRGTRDGVHEKMVARTADGLLGQVIDAGPTSCVVMLLTDLNSGVGGLVQRKGKTIAAGILQGRGRDLPLELQSLKREDDVQVGDTVVSSGYGGVFPPNLPIGIVTDVQSDPAHFLKTAIIAPAAPQPGDLREALLLR